MTFLFFAVLTFINAALLVFSIAHHQPIWALFNVAILAACLHAMDEASL